MQPPFPTHKFSNLSLKQLLPVPSQQFSLLLKQKIFKLNPLFTQNDKILYKVIEFLQQMKASKNNLKILKELVKFYQLPIMFFLKKFYIRLQDELDKFIKDNQNNNNINDHDNAKRVQKIINNITIFLQQITQIHKNLLKQFRFNNQIKFFSFLQKYNISSSQQQSQLQITKKSQQKQYINFYYNIFQQYEYICYNQKDQMNTDKKNKINKDQKDNHKDLSQENLYEKQLFLEELKIIQNNQQKQKNREKCYVKLLEDIMIQEMVKNVQGKIISARKYFQTRNEKSIYKQNQHISINSNNKKQQSSTTKQQQTISSSISNISESIKPKSFLPPPTFPLCCRPFFYQSQQILEPQTHILQYKNYKYPYDNYCSYNLKRTICSFLNRSGGTILIGIFESQIDKYKQIRGQFISEHIKEQILMNLRCMMQQIAPDIVCNPKYCVKFVPIRSFTTNLYIPGKYILRISISPGDRTQLYSYKNNNTQYIGIRTINQVLKKQISQEILNIYKKRLLLSKDESSTQLLINQRQQKHKGQCLQPDIGNPINYEKYDSSCYEYDYSSFNQNDVSDQYYENNNNKKIKFIGKDQYQWLKQKQKQKQIQKQRQKQKQKQNHDNHKNFTKKSSKPLQFNPIPSKKFLIQEQSQTQQQKFNKKNLIDILTQIDRQQYNDEPLTFKNEVEKNSKGYKQIDEIISKSKHDFNKNKQKQSQNYQQHIKQQHKSASQQPNNFNISQKSLSISMIRPLMTKQNKPNILQLLILSVPYQLVLQSTEKFSLPLVQPCIKCGTSTANWLKIDRLFANCMQIFEKFKQELVLLHKQQTTSQKKQIKIRKVTRYIFFPSILR